MEYILKSKWLIISSLIILYLTLIVFTYNDYLIKYTFILNSLASTLITILAVQATYNAAQNTINSNFDIHKKTIQSNIEQTIKFKLLEKIDQSEYILIYYFTKIDSQNDQNNENEIKRLMFEIKNIADLININLEEEINNVYQAIQEGFENNKRNTYTIDSIKIQTIKLKMKNIREKIFRHNQP